jgi:hypothetical protein
MFEQLLGMSLIIIWGLFHKKQYKIILGVENINLMGRKQNSFLFSDHVYNVLEESR